MGRYKHYGQRTCFVEQLGDDMVPDEHLGGSENTQECVGRHIPPMVFLAGSEQEECTDGLACGHNSIDCFNRGFEFLGYKVSNFIRLRTGYPLVIGQRGGHLSGTNAPLVRSLGVCEIAAQIDCDYRQAIGDDRGRRQGVLGQRMKGEAEKPTRHLPMSSPPVFESGELGEGTCHYNMLVARRFVVIPLDPPGLPGLPNEGVCSNGAFIVGLLVIFPPVLPPGQRCPPRDEGHLSHAGWNAHTELAALIEYGMNCAQSVGEWEVVEIHFGWESAGVPPADVLNAHNCIHERKVGESVEATEGRGRRKLLLPLNDSDFAVGDFGAADEGTKAICDEGGV